MRCTIDQAEATQALPKRAVKPRPLGLGISGATAQGLDAPQAVHDGGFAKMGVFSKHD